MNSYTPGTQQRPAVAVHGDSSFVVVWESGEFFYQDAHDDQATGVFLRRFDAAGERVGPAIQVSATPGAFMQGVGLGKGAGGHVVVVWAVQDAGAYHVRVRRFDPTPDVGAGAFDVTIVLGDVNAQDMCVRLTLACEGTGTRRTCR